MEEMTNDPWVIFSLQSERYAVGSQYVQTMVAMPDLVELPAQPPHVRGVINLRGQVTPLTDLRRRLGMSSYLDTINSQIEMLEERQRDHLNWLNELKASVQEERPFTLVTDHHKCKFGQWYDSYAPRNITEAQLLKQFDRPHQRIHHVAIRVAELLTRGKRDKAHALIEETRDNELSEMIDLFRTFIDMTRKQAAHEIAMILVHKERRAAISVDSVMSVEKLDQASFEAMPSGLGDTANSLASFIGKSGKDSSLVYLLDAEKIIGETHTDCR